MVNCTTFMSTIDNYFKSIYSAAIFILILKIITNYFFIEIKIKILFSFVSKIL